MAALCFAVRMGLEWAFFSLLRKRAHYHSLGGPPGPLSPSGFAPNVLHLREVPLMEKVS